MKNHAIVLGAAAALTLLVGCAPGYYSGEYYGDGYRGSGYGYSSGYNDRGPYARGYRGYNNDSRYRYRYGDRGYRR